MSMNIVIEEIGPDRYAAYAQSSPWFQVASILECQPIRDGLEGISLREVPIPAPCTKQWPDEGPTVWARTHDLTAWGIFLATADGNPVGGAAVAPPARGIVGTENRQDTAALFDFRVAPAHRRRRIGAALLRACADWARTRGFRFLSIETQNTNVPACRFYAARGCELAEIRRFAYTHCPEVANEAMLIWRLKL